MNELELGYGNFVVPETFSKQSIAFPQQSVCRALSYNKIRWSSSTLASVSALEFSLSFHAKDCKCLAAVSLKAASFTKVNLQNKIT